MFKILVLKDGIETNSAKFETNQECQDWYSANASSFVSGHVYSIEDISNEILEQNLEIESDEAIELGTKIIKNIRKLNRKKLKTNVWDNAKFNSLIANATAANIERALWNGSLNTADFLISSMTEFYTVGEINEIKAMISTHENKWRNVF